VKEEEGLRLRRMSKEFRLSFQFQEVISAYLPSSRKEIVHGESIPWSSIT